MRWTIIALVLGGSPSVGCGVAVTEGDEDHSGESGSSESGSGNGSTAATQASEDACDQELLERTVDGNSSRYSTPVAACDAPVPPMLLAGFLGGDRDAIAGHAAAPGKARGPVQTANGPQGFHSSPGRCRGLPDDDARMDGAVSDRRRDRGRGRRRTGASRDRCT